MVKVSIRVQSGAARFVVAVQAESVELAVRLVEGRYSASSVRVSGLDVLSSDGRDARTRIDGSWQIHALAA